MFILAKIALIILYILIALILLIVIISIIPFSYTFFLRSHNTDVNGNISIKWLWGFIGIRFILEDKKYYELNILGKIIFTKDLDVKVDKSVKSSKDKDMKNKVKKDKKKPPFLKGDIEYIELAKIFKQFISKFIHKFKPKRFRLFIMYGLDNPALIGILSGIIAIINSLNIVFIESYPIFTEQILNTEFEIEGKITLINLLILFISTIIKKPVRKLIFNKKKKIEI